MADSQRRRLRTDDLSWRSVEGEILILDLRTSLYWSLNSTAAFLWERLALGASPEELVDETRRRFRIGAEQAAHDVEAFLADCEKQGLLEPTGWQEDEHEDRR